MIDMKINKKNYEKFMEDNFLDNEFDNLMKAVADCEDARAEVITDKDSDNGTLKIEIKLGSD